MSLNAVEIGQVTLALGSALKGALVREVLSPREPDRIVLVLRTSGLNHYLQIVIKGGVTRVGRVAGKPRSADAPHPFVMQLRGEITGLAVAAVTQLGGDRVVDISLESGSRRARLVAEMTSRHGNLFLVGSDGAILGSFFKNRSHLRNLVPGEPYVPPFPHPVAKPSPSRFSGQDLEAEIEAHYSMAEAAAAQLADMALTRRLISSARRRLETLESNLRADLENARDAQGLKELAHVLKAHLKEVEKGASSFDTVDFGGAPVKIPLDPKKSPVENMTAMFGRAKRFGNAAADIEARLGRVEERKGELLGFELEVDGAEGERRAEIRSLLIERHQFLKNSAASLKRKADERLPYREYSISGGVVARVGRNARDNDALTLKHSKPHDLWLHVRGGGGSHVVVPLNRGDDPSPDVLVDAAHLAAHFSIFRNERDVEVIYTRRRYVQKPRGAPPGSVRVIREKTIALRVEEERLRKILGNTDV